MKKLLLITNVALLSIILFMSCNKTELNKVSSFTQGSTFNQTLGPWIETEGSPGCNPCANNSGVVFKGISADLAKSLFDRYNEENQPLLSNKLGAEDANRIWFSLESLKKFISEIERAVYMQRSANGLQLGIRIYYGKYPLSMEDPGLAVLPDDYRLHHTLFMVPTFGDTANGDIQRDFDPWHWGANPNQPTPLVNYLSGGKFGLGANSCFFSIAEKQYYKDYNCAIKEFTRGGAASSRIILNHGDINPPPPGGGGMGSGFIPKQ